MPRNYQSDDVLVLLPTLNSALDKIELKFKSIDELNLQDLKDAIDQLEGAAEGGSLADLATKDYVDTQVSPKADTATVNAALEGKVDKETYNSDMAGKADNSKFDEYTNTADLTELLKGKVDTDTFTQKLSDKVDKVAGSSLATTEQLAQIETNSQAIEAIQSQLSGIETTLSELNTRIEKVV